MRWSLLLLVAIPSLALAKPKVAVAPLDGDRDGKVAELVVEAAAENARVTGPGRVERAMTSLDITELDSKATKKLRIKLEVDVVVHGKVERDGDSRRLELIIAGRGTNKSKLELDFKSMKSLRKELPDKLAKRIAAASEGGNDDDDDSGPFRKSSEPREDDDKKERAKKQQQEEERARREEDERKQAEDDKRKERARKQREDDDKREADRRKAEDEDKRKRSRKARDEDEDDDDKRKRKRVAEDDSPIRKRARDEDDDDDDRRGRKRKRRGDDDEIDRPRHPVTQAALWLDGGGAFARRTLTYKGSGTMQPPPVGTAAAAARIEGEVYPGAFSTLRGAAAGIGFAGNFSRSFGLGIDVPKTTVTAPIKEGHYSIGARYRFAFGSSSFAIGASYWKRYYIADRSGLMMPTQLDMPDVNYTAVALASSARIAATPKIGIVLAVDVPFMLSSGPIQNGASYGAAKILAFDARAGVQIALGTHYALELAAELDQVGLSFTGQRGSLSETRSVTAATDRSMGFAATLGVMY